MSSHRSRIETVSGVRRAWVRRARWNRLPLLAILVCSASSCGHAPANHTTGTGSHAWARTGAVDRDSPNNGKTIARREPSLTASAGAASRADDLLVLYDWMTGSFSSAAQAAADSSFSDIRLEMVRIWPEMSSSLWIYIEQAAAASLSKPYRQRVCRLNEVAPGVLRSTVYELENPDAMVGAFHDPDLLSRLTPDDLELREGCHVDLRRDGEAFVGSTEGKACSSSLRGAAYATSEVSITKDRMVSWDRGWNTAGEQVWGAIKSGYVFDKIRDY